jgi:hypothetical protein
VGWPAAGPLGRLIPATLRAPADEVHGFLLRCISPFLCKVFGRRRRQSNHAHRRSAAEKRQGTKSRRRVVRRQGRGLWGFSQGRAACDAARIGAQLKLYGLGWWRGAEDFSIKYCGAFVADAAAHDMRCLRRPATVALALFTYITPLWTMGCACSPQLLSTLRLQTGSDA